MSLKLLRQYLRKKEQKELIDEIADLYKKFDSVKSYYQASVFDDDQGVLEKYKLLIEYEFFPEIYTCRTTLPNFGSEKSDS